MLINLRSALMAGKRLPYDAEVEYLECAGTSSSFPYIDTGIIGDLDTTCKARIWRSTQKTNECALGSWNRGDTRCWLTYFNNNTFYFGMGNLGSSTVSATSQVWHDAEVSKSGNVYTLTIDGAVAFQASTSASFQTSRTVYIGAMNDSGNAAYYFSGRIAYVKIYRFGVLVRDFIPVRKGTVGYLYDRVSGELFGNAGTGDFVLGPDVVPVEYIESHGTEYIDTGFKANTTTTTFETSIELTSMSANAGLFGSRNNTSMANAASCNAFVFSTGKIRLDWAAGDAGLYIDVQTGVQYEMSVTQGRYVLNGTETIIPMYAQSYDQVSNFLLFNFHNDTIPFSTGASAKMRYARLYSNSALVRKFLPVRVGTEGAMMDVLTRRIYRNAGTGAFLYGNDLKYPIPAE